MAKQLASHYESEKDVWAKKTAWALFKAYSNLHARDMTWKSISSRLALSKSLFYKYLLYLYILTEFFPIFCTTYMLSY